MKATGYGQTDPGLKRTANEDAFLVDHELGLFMVCDGVGGHAAGEVASATAVKIVHDQLKKRRDVIDRYAKDDTPPNREAVSNLLSQAVNAACAEVYRLSTADPSKRGMATTLVLLLKAGRKGVLAHVGDSRIYQSRAGTSYQLTEDHSLIAEQIKKGLLKPGETEKYKTANSITRAVGFQEGVEVDTLHVDLAPGDLYLLCTDGLHDYFKSAQEFGDFSKKFKGPELPKALIEFAKGNGGKDNVTSVVVQIEKGGVDSRSEVDGIAKTDVIQKIPLFRYLAYPELMKVLAISSIRTYQPSDTIIVENSLGTEMFVILSGSVSLLKMGQVIRKLSVGAFFGEMGLIDNAPRSASIVAAEVTRLIVITRADFYPLLRREPQLAVKLLWSFCQSLNERLRATTELLADVKADLESLKPEVPFIVRKD